MSFLNVLQTEELAVVEEYLQPIRFSKNICILQEGDPGDGCYIVDEGEIRLEIRSMETDSDGVLGYRQGPDLFLGEFSLLDGRPRSASAYADTEVNARWLSKADFEQLCEQHPKIGLTIITALGQGLTDKLRQYIERVSEYIFADKIDAQTNEMVARAVAAQQSFQNWSEERIDALLKDIAEAIVAQAELLAEATVAEICLKGRNALIFSCHRNALQVGNRTGEIIQTVLQRHGAPSDLVQWVRERTSRRKTAMFMKHPDVAFILATGGPSMVRAAYSSGTPAIGVGQGNAPVWVCADADPAATAKLIIQSKSVRQWYHLWL
ncbi:MAG: cyclic nucleotide-binding domain-containing protein [Chloroflexi bacterium]|nr:cyclic nucleotide-binding domain-containing protein [Chloroflexota bacterium]